MNDHIQHIGEEYGPTVTRATRDGASVSDMQGRVVIPGFIDGHMRFLLVGLALR